MTSIQTHLPKNTEKTKRINRFSYITEAAVEYFISLLVTGAFLAAILKNIGVSDSVTGITTGLASFAYLAQLVAVLFINPKKSVKRMVTLMHLANQLLFVLLYMVPYINVSHGVKTALFMLMFLGGHFISNAVSPFKLSWLMSFVDDKSRGKFTANKEIISLLGGMIFTYAMGALIDRFEAIGKSETGFVLSGITIFVLCIIHLVSLLIVKDTEESISSVGKAPVGAMQVLKTMLGNRNYRKIIYLDIVWHLGTGIAVSFYGTYQINELGFSLRYVAVLSAVYSIFRALLSRPFGKYADKHSWAKMLVISFSLGSLGFLINVFCVPSNGHVMFMLYQLINAAYYAGVNSGIMNITFDYVKHEQRPYALGIKAAIGGVAGFVASLAGAKIVDCIQANGNKIFGVTVYSQQILSFIAFVALAIVVVYIKTVIMKMKRTDV